MSYQRLFFSIGTACLFALNSAHAGAIDALKKFNADIDGISGQFSQTVTGKKTRKSSGNFQILRPSLFKWDYQKPSKQLIVGDGQNVWFYDVDLKQVTKSQQKQVVDSSPAAILSDKTALESNYTLKEDGSQNGVDFVLAQPKNNYSSYRSIRIGFKGDTLSEMQLQDSFGNQTRIVFSQINTAPNLSKSQFKFTPPKGVDVLEQ